MRCSALLGVSALSRDGVFATIDFRVGEALNVALDGVSQMDLVGCAMVVNEPRADVRTLPVDCLLSEGDPLGRLPDSSASNPPSSSSCDGKWRGLSAAPDERRLATLSRDPAMSSGGTSRFSLIGDSASLSIEKRTFFDELFRAFVIGTNGGGVPAIA